jgi:hypothetical protein
MKMDSETNVLSLPAIALRLRALVLALGESSVPAWWKTQFMSETGLRFLERLYPRTSFRAAIHAAARAATDAHDRAVGRVGVYHLFRLPETLETEIYRMPPDLNRDFFFTLRGALARRDELLELLTGLCDEAGADDTPGAKRMGTNKDLMTTTGLKKTAAVYRQAFARGEPAFPYFMLESIGGRE